nr:MAG TPA: hypothetical protein [Caudoviricetes sp.]
MNKQQSGIIVFQLVLAFIIPLPFKIYLKIPVLAYFYLFLTIHA